MAVVSAFKRLAIRGPVAFLLAVTVICFAFGQQGIDADSDGDGMPDAWEVMHDLAVGVNDADEDPDQDGFSNIHEYLLDTDPQDPESHPTLANNHEKLLGVWPLATNAVEGMGTGLDGDVRGGAVFDAGALLLDGKDDYVTFGSDPALGVTGSISYCVWINPEPGWQSRRLLGKFTVQENSREYAVFCGLGGRLLTFFSDDGSADDGHAILKASGVQALRKREWQHLAVSWEPSAGAAGVGAYVDAARIAMSDISAAELETLHVGSAALTLGAYDIHEVGKKKGKHEKVQNSFKGLMAQFVLCRGALTELEVREIYLLGRDGDLVDYVMADFDQDGIPDWWERRYYGDVSRPAPETAALVEPDANDHGWHNTNVTITLSVDDEVREVATTYYSIDGGDIEEGTHVTIAQEGVSTVSYWTVFDTGRYQCEEPIKTISVKLDKTGPEISVETRTPAANANGWNNEAVTVTYGVSDALSGVDEAAGGYEPDTVTTEGAGQSVSGTVTDKAGNSTSITVDDINLDLTDPVLVSFDPADGATVDGARPTVTVTFSELGAGIDGGASELKLDGADVTASANMTQTELIYEPSTDLSEGEHTTAVRLVDLAGNVASGGVTFAVAAAGPQPDTDGDLLSDAWELKYWGNLDQSDIDDPDGDSLDNFDEHKHGSDPTKPDGDGDGFPDWREISDGTDPMDAESSPQPDVYVDASAAPGGDGSQENPVSGLQAALDLVEHCGIVELADGVYSGPGNRDLDFGGKTIIVISANGPDACIINPGSKNHGFIFPNGEKRDSVVSGITITGARYGVQCLDSHPTILGCVIVNNVWGGVYCDPSSPAIMDCQITDNAGSGIEIWDSNPLIQGCVIKRNGYGGIDAYYSNPTIRGCTISANQQPGIFAYDAVSPIVIDDCVITDNGWEGIESDTCDMVIRGCVLKDNYYGGVHYDESTLLIEDTVITTPNSDGIYGRDSAVTLRRSKFLGNRYNGIYCSQGTSLLIENCVSALNGVDGIDCRRSENVVIQNCTVVSNTWAGISSSMTSPTIRNCIVWGNGTAEIDAYWGSLPTVAYSCVQGGWEGTENIEEDPRFDCATRYHLTAGSPCIDAADLDGAPEIDIDGHTRWDRKESENGVSIVDIGADEFRSVDLDGEEPDGLGGTRTIDDPDDYSPGILSVNGETFLVVQDPVVEHSGMLTLSWSDPLDEGKKLEVEGQSEGSYTLECADVPEWPRKLVVRTLVESGDGWVEGEWGATRDIVVTMAHPKLSSDEVRLASVKVESVTVIPKGMPSGSESDDPVSIGVGGMESDAHQADVTLRVLPAVASLPVDVALVGGRGHEPGRDAKLVSESATAVADGGTVTMVTGEDGEITAVLTSADVPGPCTIRAATTEKTVEFSWDEWHEEGEWTTDPGGLPESGTFMQHLTLRHHRTETDWQPFVNHEIRMFVEQVEYLDENSELQTLVYSPELDNQAELNEWASCPAAGTLTDMDGKVAIPVTLADREGLESITVAAYDWDVWNEPAAAPTVQEASTTKRALHLGAKTLSSDALLRAARLRRGQESYRLARPMLLQWADDMLLNAPLDTGVLVSKPLASVDTSKLSVKFTKNGEKTTDVSLDGPMKKASLPSKYGTASPAYAGSILFKIKASKPGKYVCAVTYDGKKVSNSPFVFTAVVGELTFDSAAGPVRSPTTDRLVVPVNRRPSGKAPEPVTVTATLKKPAGWTTWKYRRAIRLRGGAKAIRIQNKNGDAFVSVVPTPKSPLNVGETIRQVDIRATAEGEGAMVRTATVGRYDLDVVIHQMHVTIVGSTFIPLAKAGVVYESGQLKPLEMICPDVAIVAPAGDPTGKPGPTGANPGNEPVFDDASPPGEKAGECLINAEAKAFAGLEEATRAEIWSMLEWKIDNAGAVAPVYRPVAQQAHRMTILYDKMPGAYFTRNKAGKVTGCAFGSKTLTLGFKAAFKRPAWNHEQGLEFFFKRDGKSASTAAGVPAYVAKGNPNWYVYWPQIGEVFSGPANGGGKFGPQTTVMVYDPTTPTSGGLPLRGTYQATDVMPWKSKMTIYKHCEDSVVGCLKTVHHENGHLQSDQRPNAQGGWGPDLKYELAKDQDRDVICDVFENANTKDVFKVEKTDPAIKRDQKAWADRAHVKVGAGADRAKGIGVCRLNEAEVDAKAMQIKKSDWSAKGMHHR